MSLQAEKTLVGQLTLDNNTYYVTNRDGITLDSQAYSNVVIAFGSASYKAGQVSQPDKQGGGYEVGSFDIQLAFGERMREAGVNFDVTDVWNNSTATFRRWTAGDDEWADCEDFVSGIIKGFTINDGGISFSVDAWNPKDDFMLPVVVIEDQSALTDAQAKSNIYAGSSGDNYVTAVSPMIFSVGKLVRLTNDSGDVEYHYIIYKYGNTLRFLDTLVATFNASAGGKVEKAFRYAPQYAIGKTIPIQVGDLTGTTNGVFGKSICINSKIGQQSIISDTIPLLTINNLGVWEDGSKKYYAAKATNEYVVNNAENGVVFRIDSTATLNQEILDITSDVVQLVIIGGENIIWVKEDDADAAIISDLLVPSIIAIDSELMLVIAEPESTSIWVERGYGGTTKAVHHVGANIYQSAKYSCKNLLSFTERFDPVILANQYYAGITSVLDPLPVSPDAMMVDGAWSHINDGSGYLEISTIPEAYWKSVINVDLKFENVKKNLSVAGMYLGIKFSRTRTTEFNANSDVIYLSNPAAASPYNWLPIYGSPDTALGCTCFAGFSQVVDQSIDTYTAIIRDSYNEGTAFIMPSVNRSSYSSWMDGTPFLPSELTALNGKWKLCFLTQPTLGGVLLRSYKIYNIGLWVDFFLNFTEEAISTSASARPISSAVTTICGDDSPTRVGDLLTNPVDVLAHILADEIQYTAASDFTSRWSTVRDYFITTGNFYDKTAPTMAMSYGIDDDRKKGWELCEWIASHFNLMLTRDYSGKIDIVNLHEIYYNTPAGTAIDIEEILFATGSGSRRFSIAQTGTDLMYNDFIIKWRRNNSTDEYQQVYRAPDDLVTYYSETGLQSVREQFYGSQKRTLEIESPFIYSETEAIKKVRWEMDDKAEAHFYGQFFIDSDHWTEYGGKTEQYRLGDIIYFVGIAHGIDFTATQSSRGSGKFYITNIIFHDDGNEMEIHAKSLQPCTMFTADIESTSGLRIWDDTGGTAITGNAIKDDTAGTGVTGNDIKDDTGG